MSQFEPLYLSLPKEQRDVLSRYTQNVGSLAGGRVVREVFGTWLRSIDHRNFARFAVLLLADHLSPLIDNRAGPRSKES